MPERRTALYVFAVAVLMKTAILRIYARDTVNEQQASDALRKHEQSRNHPDSATTSAKEVHSVKQRDERFSSEEQAATPKAVKIAMDNAAARWRKTRNGSDIPDKPLFVQKYWTGKCAFQR